MQVSGLKNGDRLIQIARMNVDHNDNHVGAECTVEDNGKNRILKYSYGGRYLLHFTDAELNRCFSKINAIARM